MSEIIDKIRHRLHVQNNSFQCMVVGEPGSGKSYAALTMCKKIDPTFNADRIVFNAVDFMNLVQDDLPVGAAIMCDEAGMWFSSREWNSIGNRVISTVLETYRYKNLCVFWTFPVLRMTDINLRDLAHSVMETVQIDRDNQKVICKFKRIKINPISGNRREIFPKKTLPNGEKVKITRIHVSRPSPELEKAYEERKQEILGDNYDQLLVKITDKDPETKQKQKPNCKCHKCGNVWFTTSKASNPCCSRCQARTTTRI